MNISRLGDLGINANGGILSGDSMRWYTCMEHDAENEAGAATAIQISLPRSSNFVIIHIWTGPLPMLAAVVQKMTDEEVRSASEVC
jgi:hypothetical protein